HRALPGRAARAVPGADHPARARPPGGRRAGLSRRRDAGASAARAAAGGMKHAWLVGGWLIALGASALPVLWVLAREIDRNPLGKYVDGAGAWTPHVYWKFLEWW